MKTFLSILTSIFIFGCAEKYGVDFQEKSLDEIIVLASQQNKKILIDFWSDG